MIENADILFNFPVEFMDDVRLHSKRDPEEDASSTASTPPVKTTITFVDRFINIIILLKFWNFKWITNYYKINNFK